MDTTAFADSAGRHLTKLDTIRFVTRRWKTTAAWCFAGNLDLGKKPVLQFVQKPNKESYPVTAAEWSNKMMPPAIMNFASSTTATRTASGIPAIIPKLQPGQVIALPAKVAIRPTGIMSGILKL